MNVRAGVVAIFAAVLCAAAYAPAPSDAEIAAIVVTANHVDIECTLHRSSMTGTLKVE